MFMEYIYTTKKIAVAVLKALPTVKNLEEDVLSYPEALIAEVAICNAVCMHYMCMNMCLFFIMPIMYACFKIII